MNSYANELHRKLSLHKETDLIDIKDDIDELIELANDAASEYDDLQKEMYDLEDEKDTIIGNLESDIEEIEDDVKNNTTNEWGLLGEQIKETFDEIMKHPKTNQIKFLESLQFYKNNRDKVSK